MARVQQPACRERRALAAVWQRGLVRRGSDIAPGSLICRNDQLSSGMLDDHDILVEVVVRPRHAYVRLPDMRVIERPGWFQLVTPSFREGGFNDVHATLE